MTLEELEPKNMLEAHMITLDWLQYTEHGRPFDEDRAAIALKYMSWLKRQNQKHLSVVGIQKEALKTYADDHWDNATSLGDFDEKGYGKTAREALTKSKEILDDRC